jgi:hypothetical protein
VQEAAPPLSHLQPDDGAVAGRQRRLAQLHDAVDLGGGDELAVGWGRLAVGWVRLVGLVVVRVWLFGYKGSSAARRITKQASIQQSSPTCLKNLSWAP